MGTTPSNSVVKGIVERLQDIQTEKTTIEAEEAMLWKQFYGLIDDTVGEDEPFRWTHPDLLLTIGRVMATNSPRLDQADLKSLLPTSQWKLCTKQEQVFNLERLTAAVADGKVSKDDVAEATTQKPPTARKHFKPASKAELAEIAKEKLS